MKLFFLLLATILYNALPAQNAASKTLPADSLIRLEQKLIINFIDISPTDNIADIGTGRGDKLVAIANEYPTVHFTAEDIDSSWCNKTQLLKQLVKTGNKTRLENFTIQYGTAVATGLPAARFNKVLAFDLIHEMSDKAAMLADIKRILQTNGSFFIKEILVRQPAKKERACNYPYLTEPALKKIITGNRYSITREMVTYDTGHNKYIKIFECVPVN